MAEQPSLWDQADLLACLAPAERGSPPPPPTPAPLTPPPALQAPLSPSPELPEEQPLHPEPQESELPAAADGPLPAPLASVVEAEDPSAPAAHAVPGASTPVQVSKATPVQVSAATPVQVSAAAPAPDSAATPPPDTPVPQPPPTPSLPSLASARRPRASLERLLILDTETTALSPAQGDCIEVGAVLFHLPSRAVLQQISFLLPTEANPAEAINGIPAAVTRLPQPLEAARSCFLAMVASADAVVAHNAAFDRQWFGHGELPDLGLPWICSMDDIRWPADRQLRAAPSVRDLALAYGVPVWAAHRALTDCHYLVHVFQRCPELEALLVAAREPRQLYRAHLSYAERHRAREAGFRWNEPLSGAWSRRLTLAEAEALPFPVVPVEDTAAAALPRSA
jgi:DNA polymerase-3 subunit epsilon